MKKILLFIQFVLLFAACSRDNEIISENDNATNFPKEQKETDGMMVLGEKLENPYSIANMEKAYAELVKTWGAGDFKIETTDLYVRFLPKNSTKLSELQKDTCQPFQQSGKRFLGEICELYHYVWQKIHPSLWRCKL